MEKQKPEWFVYQLNRHDYDGDLDHTLFESFGEMIDLETKPGNLNMTEAMNEEMLLYYNVKQITELFEVDKNKISIYVEEYEGFGTAILTLVQIANFEEIRSTYNDDPMILFDVFGVKVLYGIDPESGIEWLYVETREIENLIESIHNADIW